MRKFLAGCFLLSMFSVANTHAQITDFMWHRGFMFGQTTLPAFNYFPDSLTQLNYQFADSTSRNNRKAFQFGLNWGARVNLFTINDERSISLHTDVLASLYVESNDFTGDDIYSEVSFAWQIPIYLNYNMGHMATKNSTANSGFAAGIGIELNSMRYEIDNVDYSGYSAYNRGIVEANTSLWIQPVVNLGYRFWKDGIDAREINLQFGLGYVDRLSTGNSYRPNIRLSYHKFINY